MYTAIAPGFFLTNIEIKMYYIKYEVLHKRFSLFAVANDFYPTRFMSTGQSLAIRNSQHLL